MIERLRRYRAPVTITFDVAAWVLSFILFAWLRIDRLSSAVPWSDVLGFATATAALYVLVATVSQFHVGRACTGSLEELVLLGLLVGGTGLTVFAVNLVWTWVPRSIPAGAALGTLVLGAWARATWRRVRERDQRVEEIESTSRALVIGAGNAGRSLIDSMMHDAKSRYRPIAILDDDRLKRHRRIRGVPVVGTTDDLAEHVARTGTDTVVVAIPSASSEAIDRLRSAAGKAGVAIKVLPSVGQFIDGAVGIRDLRDINLADVLGRNQIDTDVDSIAAYLTGRRVLVTGAGGSIGKELCRQIHRYRPAELMMLDRDESGLHGAQLSIHSRALLDSDEVILCDIRDQAAVRRIFASRRPEVVFHAAALKHLPMLEQYPSEAVLTNILGTRTLLEAADLVEVDRFINISTDKAANPSSVLGYSKRIAERITAGRAQGAAGTYLSVRFGNVLGSRGSVLTTFAQQIADGGPVTVTHPEVTRFLMTVEEACQLVIQAAAIGRSGEALVLDMGQQVRILDIACQLITQAGVPVPIEYTGLRPGEKLHEELFGDAEPRNHHPQHPLVSHVPVPPLDDIDVIGLPVRIHAGAVRHAMAEMCAHEPSGVTLDVTAPAQTLLPPTPL